MFLTKKAGAAAAVAIAAATLLGTTGTALAASSGSAQIGSAQVTPLTVVNVSGGTWNYGSSGVFSRHCWSHYVHPTHQHTATAIMGSQNVKVSARPLTWANADAYGGLFDSCAAYYNVI